MRDISIKEIIDLVASEVPDSEERIEKMFDWHFQRDMTITKWILSAAASLVVAVLVAFSKSELAVPWWQIGIISLFAFATSTYGFFRIYRIRLLHKQFIATLKLYCEFKKIAPFIKRYREVSNEQPI